jgi:pimeloyl-[acyl-carrier protein] synthase
VRPYGAHPFANDELPEVIQVAPLLSISRTHPYSGYQKIRSKSPVYLSSFGVVLVTGYAEAVAALKDPRLGRSSVLSGIASKDSEDPEERSARSLSEATVLFSNPPDHARLRSFMSRAFQPKVIEALRPHIEENVDQILDRASDRFDAIAALARPLPVQTIAELIGVPRPDWDRCVAFTSDLAPTIDVFIPQKKLERAGAAMRDFVSYVRDLVEERRRNPGPDLLSNLVRIRDSGGELSEDELVSNIITLFGAGHETTTNLIGNAIVLLSEHRGEYQRLIEDPRLIDSAIEEVLRYEPAIQLAARTVLSDTELAGHRLYKGQGVWVMLGAANRDPARFPDPDRFDVTRDPNPHLAFGSGIHFCLGAALARLEARIVLSKFFARFPKWRLVEERLELCETLAIRGFKRLTIELSTGRG